ncbi:ArsR/SmtB family transcription factor [Thermomonospora cellulosilytica]|uniref:DNA-binding transcriptional ArsR family regulator n=1 Tax=Thermomonospora cellulosilytica TaxID=1411118 RepID=A0A7W3RAI0_9ACTN|nr:helix-turn-helix transcriptional regulator [Thermomonospora cellulosilytica]MBA9005325.1 DNA-binding transcriptional ArsR family regulator [Thermomonospora cellulosilytica]
MDSDRIPQHPDVRTITLQRVLEALADPVRRSIVTQLWDAPEDLRCGAFDLPVSNSTATHHFRVLREAGLIRQYYVGTSRMNALRRDEVGEVFPGLLDAVVAADRRSSRAGAPT